MIEDHMTPWDLLAEHERRLNDQFADLQSQRRRIQALEDKIAALRKQIDKLSGVHGA